MWKAFGSVPKLLLFKHEEADHFCIPALIYRNWRHEESFHLNQAGDTRESFCIPSYSFEPSDPHSEGSHQPVKYNG